MSTTTLKTFQTLVSEAKASIEEITISDLAQWQEQGKPFTLVDVREPGELENGVIPGSITIPRGLLEMKITDAIQHPDTPVVIHCAGGARSALGAQTLKFMGYSNVYSLAGGFKAYKDANP